jgi:hypothetical protein
MLVSQFERIRMLEDETFNDFYNKINDIRNSMINLGKKVSDAKLIKKILRSLPERFKIKFTTVEESKDLDTMKIAELVGSQQTYEFSLPQPTKNKSIALKTVRKEINDSSDEESMVEEDLALIVRKLNRLLKWEKNSRGIQCNECGGYGHIRAKCANLQGNAFNITLCDKSDSDKIDETSGKDLNFLAFAGSYDSPHESNNYYSENNESEDEQNELQRVYNKLFVKFYELREVNKKHVKRLNEFEIERSRLIKKVKCLEDELNESHRHLEKISSNKLVQMLNGQKCSYDKSGLGFDKFPASSSHDSSIPRTVFVKPEISETHVACLDKGKNIIDHEHDKI